MSYIKNHLDTRGFELLDSIHTLNEILWKYFNENKDYVIVSKHFLWLTISVKIKDLRWLFVELIGPEPVDLNVLLP